MRTKWDIQHITGETQEDNASAKTLKETAITIGINFESEKVSWNRADFEIQSRKLEQIWDELNHHVRAEAVASGPPDTIPEETQKFVRDCQENILLIKKHLLGEKAPIWGDLTSETEFFSTLKAILRLHHLLAADSLFQLTEGSPEKAEASLAGCWKLTDSLNRRKEPISVFLALKCSSIQMGLMKKLPSIPDVWQIRFRTLDYRKAFTAALSAESTRFFDTLSEKSVRRKFLTNELTFLPEWGQQPAAVLLDPYMRICRLNYLASEKELIAALRNSKHASDAPKRQNHLLSDFIHDYESIHTKLLDFEKKQKKF